MITKKLGKITFAWDPNAKKGEGYWFVAGKDDTYARAASKEEASKLGLPEQSDLPEPDASEREYEEPKQKKYKKSDGRKYFGFKTYMDVEGGRPVRRVRRTDSDYETQDIIRSKGLGQLATERLLSGDSLGSSVKGALGDKIGAVGSSIEKFFDPMMMLSKLPGIGQLAAAYYGKKMGRDSGDIAYATGVLPQLNEDIEEETKEKDKPTAQKIENKPTAQKIEDKTTESTTEKVTEEEKYESEKGNDKRHDELIDAIKNTYRWGESVGSGEKSKDGESSSGMGKFGEGLKSLGNVGKVLLSMAASLWIVSKALQNFATVTWESVVKGVAALAALAASTKLLKDSDSWKSLLALGASLWIVSKALQNFSEVDWESIAKGLVAMGGLILMTKALQEVGIKGTLVLIAMSGALWIFSKSLSNFADLEWEDLGKAAAALTGLGVALFALGTFAGPILIGAGALAVASAALWGFGEAMKVVGEAMDQFVTNIARLSEIDAGNLLKVAMSMVALGGAMIAFGAAQMATALQNLVTNFLSIGQDSPVEQLEKIGEAGPGIEKAAEGMERLADAMAKFADVDTNSLDDLMDALNKFPWLKATAYASVGGVFNVQTKEAFVVGGAAKNISSSGPIAPKASKPGVGGIDKTTALSGITKEQIVNHPNFKKYYEQELKEFPGDTQSAYQFASDRVRQDIISKSTKKTNLTEKITNNTNNTSVSKLTSEELKSTKSQINTPIVSTGKKAISISETSTISESHFAKNDFKSYQKFNEYRKQKTQELIKKGQDPEFAYIEATELAKEKFKDKLTSSGAMSSQVQQISSTPELSQRMNQATSSNLDLKSEQSKGGSPTVINNTNNVMNNSSSGGGGKSAKIRNEDPVLLNLQYQSVRPV